MTNVRFARTLVWVNGAIPAALIAFAWYHHELGADPTDSAIHQTGRVAITFLALSLLVTPVRRLTGWNDAITFRRVLGLYAFYYATAHLGIFYYQQGGRLHDVISQIKGTLYLQIGLASLVAMVPLAVTSNNFMVRAMGPIKWQALHRLAYVAAGAASIHFLTQGKVATALAVFFAWAMGILLAYRYGAMFFARGIDRAVPTVRGLPVEGGRGRKFWKGRLRVARVFAETPTVRTFRLTTPDGGPIPFDYKPGQYLNLMLTVDGNKVNRSYTISSSPSRVGNVELTVKREPAGVSSRHLHDMVHEGDQIDVSAPGGKFIFTGTEADSIVLISGGVGITPMMSVARYLADRAWPGDVYFVYSGRTPDDLIFRQELLALEKRFPNFHLFVTLTRADGSDWSGRRGRLSADVLREVVPGIAGRLVHVCGPTEMMDPVRLMLRELGVPENRIKSEKFESRASTPDTDMEAEPSGEADSAATIEFALSGKSTPADGHTVLEAAEAVGVDIPYDCRAGICGTCKVKLNAGKVWMDSRDALSAKDESAGFILACQAMPLTDLAVKA